MVDLNILDIYAKELNKQIDHIEFMIKTSCQTDGGLARLNSELVTLKEALKQNQRLYGFYRSPTYKIQNNINNPELQERLCAIAKNFNEQKEAFKKSGRNYDPNMLIGAKS